MLSLLLQFPYDLKYGESQSLPSCAQAKGEATEEAEGATGGSVSAPAADQLIKEVRWYWLTDC